MENGILTKQNQDEKKAFDFARTCQELGEKFGVAGSIHPNDFIYQFQLKVSLTPHLAVHDYFESGFQSTQVLKNLINAFMPQKKLTLLEFASGYGRLTRHFPNVLPEVDAFACDIHQEAVEYIQTFGAQSLSSSKTPENFYTGKRFDVVFALSFFTHMPEHTWGRWLRALARQLEPGGILMMTTHGVPALKGMGFPDFDRSGFQFATISEQEDLDTAEYGSTATSFDYVYKQLALTELDLIHFREAGFGYQDLYIMKNRTR